MTKLLMIYMIILTVCGIVMLKQYQDLTLTVNIKKINAIYANLYDFIYF